MNRILNSREKTVEIYLSSSEEEWFNLIRSMSTKENPLLTNMQV